MRFAAQPSLGPRQVRELATAYFIANGEAVLLCFSDGRGWQLAPCHGLGHEVIR